MDIGVPLQLPPPILWCDNIGAQALASNPIHHARIEHIELNVPFVRNLVAEHKLEVRYIFSEHQPVDIFTESLALDRFSYLCRKLSLGSP